MLKMRLLPVIVLSLVSCRLFAQGEISQEERTFWRNERSIGGSIYSNGWSLDFAEYRQVKPSTRLFIETSLGGYKDPKEVKIQNTAYLSPYSFVYGKINMNWHLNGGFGYQHEIFEKRDLGGVAISWNICGGPIVTFCKPIYYKVIKGITNEGELIFEEKKFDITTMNWDNIYGKASIFKGMNEIKVIPGGYLHGGFSFEYGDSDKITKTLEVGSSLTAFTSAIPIMDDTKHNNKMVFFSLYASYKIGFILDPLKMQNDFLTSLFSRKKE